MLGWEPHLLSSCARLPWTALHPLFYLHRASSAFLCCRTLPPWIYRISKAPAVPVSSFSEDWKRIEGEIFDEFPLSAVLGCTEQRAAALICSGHSEANKSCSGSSSNIQMGFSSTKAFSSLPCREELWGVSGNHWDCLINTEQRESPLSAVPRRKKGVE